MLGLALFAAGGAVLTYLAVRLTWRLNHVNLLGDSEVAQDGYPESFCRMWRQYFDCGDAPNKRLGDLQIVPSRNGTRVGASTRRRFAGGTRSSMARRIAEEGLAAHVLQKLQHWLPALLLKLIDADCLQIMQLEIFEHSRDVMLRNDLVEALLRRDATAARSARQALADAYPQDTALADASVLIEALDDADDTPWLTHAAANAARNYLEQHVGPAARGTSSALWLAELWGGLAQRASALPFRADEADAHSAALCLRAGRWQAAASAAESIESWRRIPAPLSWVAHARWHLMGVDAVWPLLAELAWLSPTRFEQLTHALNDAVLQHLLRRFRVDFDGSGETDDLMWFPAWALAERPRLAGLFVTAQPSRQTDPERAWQLMLALLKLEHEGATMK